MPKKDSELIPDGNRKEMGMTYLLQRLGFRMTITTEFDHEFATDALITGHRRVDRKVRSIALQLTKARRGHGKAGRFVSRAGRRFKGPLLFAKFRGEPTLEKASAIADALLALWNDPEKAERRAHGVVARRNGTLRWFSIPQP